MEEAHNRNEREIEKTNHPPPGGPARSPRGRNERRKRRELDDKITQLAAAQLVTEEKFKEWLEVETRRFGGNGQH